MTRTGFHLMVLGLVLPPALAALAGGWAVITVEELPDYVVAGEPVTLTFTVRQHGMTRLDGLRPKIEATAGNLKARASATAAKRSGEYAATLALPEPGQWTITIHSGFGNSKTTLLPLAATEAGAEPLAILSELDRGRRLFVAKGCVTCHVETKAGPELTGRRFERQYLEAFLANPTQISSNRSGDLRMPNLNLRPREITALVAFINAENRVGVR